jgi:phosphoglycolate phosphatase
MTSTPALGHVRALLFDFDGTLVEPSIDFRQMKRAVLAVARDFGHQPSGGGQTPVLEIIAQVHAQILRKDAVLAAQFETAAQQAVVAIEMAAAERVRAYAGVAEMLAEIERLGLRVAIVTRNCRDAVRSILERIPLRHHLLLTRDDVPYVKPDPRHLAAALDALGVLPTEAAMCGDHVMDIQAGRAVGALTVGVLPAGVGPEVFAACPPDLTLYRVTDLLGHLDPGAMRRAAGDSRREAVRNG